MQGDAEKPIDLPTEVKSTASTFSHQSSSTIARNTTEWGKTAEEIYKNHPKRSRRMSTELRHGKLSIPIAFFLI